MEKHEISNTKLETNYKLENSSRESSAVKGFDLEDRTLRFAKDVRIFVRGLPKDTSNYEDIKQITRSSGSIGANYLEANESLSKKDFIMRIKISKKETRETIYWLELLKVGDKDLVELVRLSKEATELLNILGAILRNSSK